MTGTPLIPRPAVPAVPVGHGYTLADLDRIAVRAAAGHWSRSGSHSGRLAAAWSAAAEALCTTGCQPSLQDLYRAARDGIMRHVAEGRQFYGLSKGSGYTATTAAFEGYWYQPPLTGWEDAIVDRIALGQIWAAISPAHRRALSALADSGGDYRAAADSLGTTYATYRTRLGRARQAFRELWHEGEEPSRQWGRDRARDDPEKVTHCPADHEYTPENTLYWRMGRRIRRRCRTCEEARVAARRAATIPYEQADGDERAA